MRRRPVTATAGGRNLSFLNSAISTSGQRPQTAVANSTRTERTISPVRISPPGTPNNHRTNGGSPSARQSNRTTEAGASVRRFSRPAPNPRRSDVIPTVAAFRVAHRAAVVGSSRRVRQTSRGSSSGSNNSSGGSSNSGRNSNRNLSRSSTRTRRGSRARVSRIVEHEAEERSTTALLADHMSQISTASSSSRHSGVGHGHGSRAGRRRSRSNSHVSFLLPTPESNPNPSRTTLKQVMENEKFLQRIFTNLNWNELLVTRQVCKRWLEVISGDPELKDLSGVMAIHVDFEALPVLIESLIIWTQFRFYAPMAFDLSQRAQSEFWRKHGESMTYLELRGPGLTLKGLVEVLSQCPNLLHFLVVWTPEMYSFNPELIKKYYNISIRNGTFGKMKTLAIEKSSFLTDSGLLTLLKWCGGSLQSLSLTCSIDDLDESLSRLKPRWTIEPFETYTNRFSYSKNLKFLDFSGSNMNAADLTKLGEMDKLVNLTGIRLSRCKITDAATVAFLLKKGSKLEQLYLDYTLVTEDVFNVNKHLGLNLKNLLLLDLCGTKNFTNIDFIMYMINLEDFRCGDTSWLNHTMLLKPIDTHNLFKGFAKVNFSCCEKSFSKTFDETQRSAWFLRFCITLRKLTELNLDQWITFGTDEAFKRICFNIPHLKKLRVRGWGNLTDEGIIGFSYQELIDMDESERDIWSNERVPHLKQALSRLENLKLLDLGGCIKLTDVSVQFGILFLPNLRTLGLDGSRVSDIGIHVLIAKCRTLDKISVLGCDQITPKGKKIHRLDGRSVQFGSIRLDPSSN